jgi:hypothetical protein
LVTAHLVSEEIGDLGVRVTSTAKFLQMRKAYQEKDNNHFKNKQNFQLFKLFID